MQVPYLMGLKIPLMVKRLLDQHRLKREDITHWGETYPTPDHPTHPPNHGQLTHATL